MLFDVRRLRFDGGAGRQKLEGDREFCFGKARDDSRGDLDGDAFHAETVQGARGADEAGGQRGTAGSDAVRGGSEKVKRVKGERLKRPSLSRGVIFQLFNFLTLSTSSRRR